jgi:hypothetical protein
MFSLLEMPIGRLSLGFIMNLVAKFNANKDRNATIVRENSLSAIILQSYRYYQYYGYFCG